MNSLYFTHMNIVHCLTQREGSSNY